MPGWMEYYRQPDRDTHNRIYNSSSIYLASSLQEGWGLTVGEAAPIAEPINLAGCYTSKV